LGPVDLGDPPDTMHSKTRAFAEKMINEIVMASHHFFHTGQKFAGVCANIVV